MPAEPHRDAGGDSETLERKQALREEAWTALADAGAERFPGAQGRIPNFVGAEDAAERLRQLEVFSVALAVKANPDAPQWPVRQRALEDGHPVVMAVPRLAADPAFLLLDPETLPVSPRKASSIKGADQHAQPVDVTQMPAIGLVVVGCVAVDRDGRRLGKGGGFADLEYAVAREADVIGRETPVVTTVHPAQVLETGRIPVTGHDVGLDLIVTPEEVIRCDRDLDRGGRILWEELTEEKVAEIPLLARLGAQDEH